MLLLDEAKDRRRDAANRQMIDLALSMVRVHAAQDVSTNQASTNQEPAQ
jgi:hypothetical protein